MYKTTTFGPTQFLKLNSVFDRLLDDYQSTEKKQSAFYNKIWNEEDGILELQLAFAGYDKGDIKITLDKSILEVSTPNGSSMLPKGDDQTVKFRGISNKKHLLKFKLSDNAELLPVKFENGLLTIRVKEVHIENPRKEIPIQ